MPLHLLGICRREDIATLPADWPGGQPGMPLRGPEETCSARCRREIRWLADGPLAAATVPPAARQRRTTRIRGLVGCPSRAYQHSSRARTEPCCRMRKQSGSSSARVAKTCSATWLRVAGSGEIGLRVDLADLGDTAPERERGAPAGHLTWPVPCLAAATLCMEGSSGTSGTVGCRELRTDDAGTLSRVARRRSVRCLPSYDWPFWFRADLWGHLSRTH